MFSVNRFYDNISLRKLPFFVTPTMNITICIIPLYLHTYHNNMYFVLRNKCDVYVRLEALHTSSIAINASLYLRHNIISSLCEYESQYL